VTGIGRDDRGREKLVILLYNVAWGQWPDACALACSPECEFTTDWRQLFRADAVVFHVPSLEGGKPPPKRPGQRWVAWSSESEVNYPLLADHDFMRRFEITMTYRRDATVWCPYFGADTVSELARPPRAKTGPSPAVYLQSSAVNKSGRIEYAAELMRHISVDSYGAILRNRPWEGADAGRESKLGLIARYKFTLAFENSLARDYVTEKFYDPLVAGSVPVYLGAANVADFAPAEHSFIDVADFGSPADLAAHLCALDQDDQAYAGYLAWKPRGPSPGFRALAEGLQQSGFCRLCTYLRTGRAA
jgi:alpha-1,3-fucosyltransferase 10